MAVRGPGSEAVAVGATSTTLAAVLLDLRPGGGLAPLMSSNAPVAGLAVGALLTGALMQYGPAPTQLTWWLLLGAFAVAFILAAVMPEMGTRRPGALASVRPQVSVPHPARGAFARGRPAIVAVGAGRLLPVPGTHAGRAAGRLIAAIFTFNYLSFGIPAPIAGITTTHYGLHATARRLEVMDLGWR